MTDCYIYARVSSKKQVNEGTGLESQIISCMNYAKENGYKVIKTYKERGVSTAPILEWEVDDGVASVANTHISRRSSVSNSHYYEVGQQVLNGLTRDKDTRSLDGR